MDYITNATYDVDVYTHSSYNPGWSVTVGQVFQGLLTAWVFVSNFLLILSLATDQIRRKRPINLSIMNLAMVGLLASIFVLPFDIYSYSWLWFLGITFCDMWMTLIYVFCAVSAYIIIIISGQKLLLIIKPRMYQQQTSGKRTVGLMVLPWVVGLIFIVSLMISGLPPHARIYPYCLFETELVRATVMCILAFFLPSFLILGVNAVIIVLTFIKTRITENRDPSNESLESITSVIVVAGIFVLMWLADFVVVIGAYNNDYIAFSFERTHEIAIWIGYANYGLCPLLWMIDRDFRQGYRRILNCGRQDETPLNDVTTDTFRERCDNEAEDMQLA